MICGEFRHTVKKVNGDELARIGEFPVSPVRFVDAIKSYFFGCFFESGQVQRIALCRELVYLIKNKITSPKLFIGDGSPNSAV